MRPERRISGRGFTLIEALAAVLLLIVGVSSAMHGLGALSRAQRRAQENEDMQRLAIQKYDEILALGALNSGEASGDFREIGEDRFIWSARRMPTGYGNLDSIQVDVARRWEGLSKSVEVQGLFCRPVAGKGGS